MDQTIEVCSIAWYQCPTCKYKWTETRHKDPVNRSEGGGYCGKDFTSCIVDLALNRWEDPSVECTACLEKKEKFSTG